MKKIYYWSVLILMMIAFLPEWADAQSYTQRETHVTVSQAMNVGYTFMRTGGGSTSSLRGATQSSDAREQMMQLVYTGQAIDSLTGVITDCYYVFALQPKGFVIVAADERVEPILGYSYDNNFVMANMPAHVRAWLGNYEKQIEAATKSNLQAKLATQTKWTRLKSGQSMSTRSGETVGPLLTTTWDQGQYYNALCPEDADGPDGHVWAGCVATAMAQIIYYWGAPVHGRGTHRYNSSYGTLSVNYGNASYDYTLMPSALTSTSTPQEVNAVATLMRDCGVAVNMGYSSTESSAFDQEARAALINFFRFSPDLSFAEKSYFAESEWDAMLHANLDNNRPVFYSGQGSGGHAFVCDGYDANGYYHFNFGWGGFADGWYLTGTVTPGGMDFSSDQSAIFGIVPDSTGNVILGQMAGTSTFVVDEPLEFYHLMGHNAYEGENYSNICNNILFFVPADSTNQLVADIIEFEDQTLSILDANGWYELRYLSADVSDLSPEVTTDNVLGLLYWGDLSYSGFKLIISQTNGNDCRMVSNITSSVEANTVHLTWTENSTASQWEIEYGVKGFALGTGTTYISDTNTVTFSNMPKFTEYDFYIRSVCGTGLYGLWNKVSIMVEAEYWQDIVTSQPAGYVYNAQTNSVEISTAEGLAWWAKNFSCFEGYYGRPKVYLTADIDLSGYKWRPADVYYHDFDGQGHIITNAYIRENGYWNGFFSTCWEGIVENLGLTNSYIYGRGGTTGGLCGYSSVGNTSCTMRNCYVSNCTIDGADWVGGLIGNDQGTTVINCYVNANVIGNRWTGLMSGSSDGTFRNCYAVGSVRERTPCYIGGIVAYLRQGEVSHCYGIETDKGLVGYRGGMIVDTSTIIKNNDSITLLTPIVFNGIPETDLLSALNLGLGLYNDSLCRTWMADTGNVNDGYPVLAPVGCPVTLPTVTTNTVNNITAFSATCGGNVIADGGTTVTARGVCWSTSQNPTVADAHTSDGTGTGAFTSSITNLAPGTTYYVRAYATNSVGTAYGEEVTFATSCPGIALPYFENFDSYTQSTTTATGVEPPCWELVQEDVTMTADKLPQLYRKSSYAHSGKYSLLLNGRCVYAMPALAEPLEVPISQLKLEMYVRQSKAQYMLQVGIWEDDGTFVPVATVNNQSTDVEHVVCSFAGYTGNGRRIAFRNVLAKGYSSKYSVNFIDDISLTDICEPVTLPYSEDFELYTQSTTTATGVEPPCWELVQEDVTMTADKLPQLYRKSSYAHSGKYSLLLNGRCVYAMPALAEPLEVPISQLKLEMYVRQSKAQYMLQVGVWEDDGTFVPVATVNNQSTDVERVVCSFAGYTGNGRRIAFRNVLAKGYSSKYSVNSIDDISLTDICEPVTLPYSEDFELYTQSTTTATGVEPPCWELVQEDVTMTADKLPQLYRKSSYAHSGKYSLLLNGRCVYAMPALAEPLEVPINQIKLEMYVCQTKPQNMLEVGIWEDDGTFVPVATVNNQSTDVEHVVCSFAGYTGNGRRIAFRNVLAKGYTSKYSVNFIDDISLTDICEPVTLPYSEDFELYTQSTETATGVEPPCWELVQKDVAIAADKLPQLYRKASYAHSGKYSLLLNGRCVYAMPSLAEPLEVPISQLKLDMYVCQTKPQNMLEVGIWEDDGTFVPVDTVNNQSTDVEHVVCSFAGYTGPGHRIAFRNVLANGYSSKNSVNFIDDINITSVGNKNMDVTNAGAAYPSETDASGEMAVSRYLENITLYPNPTTGVVHIDAAEVQRVECYTMMGQVVAEYNEVRDIDISQLTAGVYMLRITLPQGVIMRKVVKR